MTLIITTLKHKVTCVVGVLAVWSYLCGVIRGLIKAAPPVITPMKMASPNVEAFVFMDFKLDYNNHLDGQK